MKAADVHSGLRVRITDLEATKGWLVEQRHLGCRRLNVTGTIRNAVSGHGGYVWWVEHDGSDEVGAYGFPEMTQLLPDEDPGADHRGRRHQTRKPLGSGRVF